MHNFVTNGTFVFNNLILLYSPGYKDTGAYWRSWYESPTFQSDLEKLLEELKPFYAQLHTYVRSKLIDMYGVENFPASGQIPAHLLGKISDTSTLPG